MDKKPQWYVYHGGALYGLGRWSGPHDTVTEAMDSAQWCLQTVGGTPIIHCDDES